MALTAKEKAEELVIKFSGCQPVKTQGTSTIMLLPPDRVLAKQCALICVEEMIGQWEEIFHAYGIGYMGHAEARNDVEKSKRMQYLRQVKEEISKL